MITKKGTVVRISGKKTIKVQVNDYHLHPKYKKSFRKTHNFLVHDEEEKSKVGDAVLIEQSRPFSKKKSWIISSTK